MTYLISLFTFICLAINEPGITNNDYQNLALTLNPACWHNWTYKNQDDYSDPKFTPTIYRLSDARILEAANLAKKYPGRTWFLYNEPEGKDQANISADLAVPLVKKAIEQIKKADPTAKIACCGVMIRVEGIDWVNRYIALGGTLPDYWHIHIYALDKTGWQSAMDYWHYWNNLKGKNIPTLVTETCGMFQANQTELMKYVLAYKHDRIKAIYWFSSFVDPNNTSWKCSLFNSSYQVNTLGNIYKSNQQLPNKLTPTTEPPTPTVTPTKTPTPTLTPISLIPLPTPTIPVDETTGEIGGIEPVVTKIYFSIIFQ